jgi:choline dehydrogenase-like flavoprotein
MPRVLKAHSIDTVVAIPSVGENLQDQTNSFFAASTNGTFSGYPPYATFANATDLFGSTTTEVYHLVLSELASYAKSIAELSDNALEARAQEQLLRIQLDLIFKKSVPVAEFLTVPNSSPSGSIIGSAFWGLLPFARGSVHISSTDISASPAINPNFFMLEWDQELQVAAAKLARKSLSTIPLANLVSAEVSPGAAVPSNASDQTWLKWLKDNCTLCFFYL